VSETASSAWHFATFAFLITALLFARAGLYADRASRPGLRAIVSSLFQVALVALVYAVVSGQPVLQIGMDTPQVTAELLTDCARTLLTTPALLGLARDGGWWVLGVADAASAECLRDVPMSQDDTGAVTLAALRDTGISVKLVEELLDVDTVDDIPLVRAACRSESRFAHVTREV